MVEVIVDTFDPDRKPTAQVMAQAYLHAGMVDEALAIIDGKPVEKHLPGHHDQLTHGHGSVAVGAANSIVGRAKSEEPGITRDMKSIVGQHGGEMVGLEFRMKSRESTARKVHAKVGEGMTPEQAQAGIKDSVRYTAVFPSGDYGRGAHATVASLRRKGYKQTADKNYWHQPGDGGYKGINTNWETPSGLIIEVQFHTPESWALKEGLSHKLYEQLRVTKSAARKQALDKQSRDAWGEIPIPGGV